mmetsp:Transcript_58370/g.186062  ORF Transcript_58370/g.186062 Transcript_58370/m.186062 type:complete len:276 (-) Transcript_58370:2545-3372(-)
MPGIALKSALITTFMPSLRLAMRIGRSARNVRSARSALSWSPPLRLMKPTTTMKKSRMFQLERRYAPLWKTKPSTSTLSTISIAKRITKMRSTTLITSLALPERPGESIASTSEERQMRAMMKYSNILWQTRRARRRRSGLVGGSTKSALPLSAMEGHDPLSSTVADIWLILAEIDLLAGLCLFSLLLPVARGCPATAGRGSFMPVAMDEWSASTGEAPALESAAAASTLPSSLLGAIWLPSGLASSFSFSSSSSSSPPSAKLSSRMARKRLRMM